MTNTAKLLEMLNEEIAHPPTQPIAPDFYLGVVELCATALAELQGKLEAAIAMIHGTNEDRKDLSRLKALLVRAREGLLPLAAGCVQPDRGPNFVRATEGDLRRAAALVREIDEVMG